MNLVKLVMMFSFALLSWSARAEPLLINIDNPQFRKMVTAIPIFAIDPQIAQKEEAEAMARQSAEELRYLLDFTGLFNNMSEAGYKGIIDSAQKTAAAAGKIVDLADKASLAQWKAVGIESLTVGVVLRGEKGYTLELRTFDVNRQATVLGKRYVEVSKAELKKVLRRYGNLLMEMYTGKPGIFFSKIAFIGRRSANDFKQVYICDFDGSNVVQLTSEPATHLSAHFSPDGRYITYTSFERKNPDLYMHDLETGKKRLISSYPGINSGAQWAPNGKLIAYTGSKDGDTDIFILDPFKGSRTKLISGSGVDVDPTFSPDGKRLAFVSGRFGNPHIFIAQLDWNQQTGAVSVSSDMRITYAGWYNSTPAWAPDSERLVFAGYDKDIDRYDIFIVNREGKQLERLTLKTGDNESPSYAPNGYMIVFQSNRVGDQNIKGVPQLWIMNWDGGGQRKLETGIYDAQTPSWSFKLYE